MNPEARVCQNCKQQFVIEPEDFRFYEKVKVPAPTFCPACRLQRRLTYMNLNTLYRRACDLCKKITLSMYAPESPHKQYCARCWWGDGWDPFSYGRDFDPSKPFLQQWHELMREVPHMALAIEPGAMETAPHTNFTGSMKNSYLMFHSEFDEECLDGFYVYHSSSLLDTSLALNAERCYDSMHIYKVNGGVGLRNQVVESIDCGFLRDSFNCQHCFASANLRNAKFVFKNRRLTKEQYEKELAKIDLGSYAVYERVRRAVERHWDSLPERAIHMDMVKNCTGNQIFECKNCKDSFEVWDSEDCRYAYMLRDSRDCYDVTSWAGLENCYEASAIGDDAWNVKFSSLGAIGGGEMEYSFLTIAGTGFFGCVSVKKGDYVILNKRYTKAQFEKLRQKIVEHMNAMPYTDSRGRAYTYGEFFPVELSPWAYNETLAQRLFPLTEDEARVQGFAWRVPKPVSYKITKKAEELPDHIKEAPNDIVKEVVECAKCQRGFKIVPLELDLLRRMNLPLPRICPFCRIDEKLNRWFDEAKLVDAICAKCGKSTQTTRFKAKKSLLFCRECYQKETR